MYSIQPLHNSIENGDEGSSREVKFDNRFIRSGRDNISYCFSKEQRREKYYNVLWEVLSCKAIKQHNKISNVMLSLLYGNQYCVGL